jgi:hypothetical protein
MAALFSLWGDEKGNQFLASLKGNQVKLSTGNGERAQILLRLDNSTSLWWTVTTQWTGSVTATLWSSFIRIKARERSVC